MARLYANENFPLPVVEELRRLDHDVLRFTSNVLLSSLAFASVVLHQVAIVK